MKKFNQTLFVMVGKKENVDYTTLSSQKKQCIKYFLENTFITWKEAKKYGWKCIKVDVQILENNKKAKNVF
jgi:hypothetical protein